MHFKKNEIEIIKLLISSSQYLTSYDIANATGINRRLVRDEMANVRNILKTLGYELISKTSKGYIIQGQSSHSLHALEKIIEDAERQRESIFPTMPHERQNFLLKRLIDQNGYIKIDELADELLMSRSTISSDLKKAKQSIKKYHLSFQQKPNYGIRIIGDEVDKRKSLCDYLFTNLGESEMYYDYLHSYITQKDSLEYGIIEIIKKNQIEMSDIALCDFLLCLSISVSRIMVNQNITQSPDLSLIQDRHEFQAAQEIAHFIESRTHCYFNEYEVNQIAIQLICKRSSRGLTPHHNRKILDLVDEILSEIEKQTLIVFHDAKFLRTFSLYVESAILCIVYHEKIRTPLYNELKTAYPLAYELAEITSTVIKKHYHEALSMSSLAFFATIFNTAINNQKTEKKKTLLLCGLGGGVASFNSQIILKRFKNQINIVKTSQYYKLPEEDLSSYEFIISTVPIHGDLSIPHINVSQMITQDDLDKIESYLSYDFHKGHYEILFHPKIYKSHVKVRTYKSMMNEFYKLLKSQYPIIKESFKNNLLTHEQCSLIYAMNKIGIIKLKKPFNNNQILSVLILEEPLFYQTHLIQIVILFSCVDAKQYLLNTLISTLTNIAHDEKSIHDFLQHPTYPHFLKMMIEHQ